MQRNMRTAFNRLKAIGAPVIERPEGCRDGAFVISAEENYDEIWASMYEAPRSWDFGVNPKIVEILDELGLYAEWINGGCLGVYEA